MSKKRSVTKANRDISGQNKRAVQKNKSKNVSYQEQSKSVKLSNEGFISTPNLFDKYIGNMGLLISLVLILLVGFTAYWDYLTLKYSYFFSDIGSDTLNTHMPALNKSRNPQHGPYGIPGAWSFYIGMGQNSFGGIHLDPIKNVFNWIDRQLGAIYGSDFYISGKFPNHFFTYILLSGLLFFAYLRTLRLSKYTSIVGSLLYSFLGYMTLGSTWGHSFYMFFAASLLFSFEQLYQKNRWIFFPFAILFLSGNAYYVYMYGAVFIGTYSVFRYIADKGIKVRGYINLFSKMVLLGSLGMAMNLSKIISRYIKQFGAPRVSGNVSFMASGGKASVFKTEIYESFDISEKITMFFRLFSNDLLGNGSNFKGWYNYLEAPVFYCGLITILLVPLIFFYLKGRKKRTYFFYLAFWVLVALIPFLRHAIQAFVGNYYKNAIDVFIPTVLIFFGLHSLDKITLGSEIVNKSIYIPLGKKKYFNIHTGKNGPVLTIWLVFLLSLIGLYYPYDFPGAFPIDRNLRFVVSMLLLSYTILLSLYLTFRKYRFYLQIIILIVICIELSYTTGICVNRRAAYSTEEIKVNGGGFKDNTIEAVNFVRKIDKGFFRLEKEYSSGTSQHRSVNDAKFQRYYGTANYSSYNQKYYVHFLEGIGEIKLGTETQTRWAPGLKRRPLLETLASVKYYLSKFDEPIHQKNGLAFPIAKVKDITVLKNRYALPFGFTYDSYILRKDYDKMNQLQKDIAMLRAFVIDSNWEHFDEVTQDLSQLQLSDTISGFTFKDYKAFTDKLRQDTLQIQKQSMSYFEGDIDVKKDKVLFFSTPWDMGWRCRIDGQKVNVHRVNIGLVGVFVPKGKHHVVFEYVPPFYKASIAAPYIAYIILGLLLIIKNFKKIKNIHNDERLKKLLLFLQSTKNKS